MFSKQQTPNLIVWKKSHEAGKFDETVARKLEHPLYTLPQPQFLADRDQTDLYRKRERLGPGNVMLVK